MTATAKTWDRARAYARSLPNAAEDLPWGELVVKVEKRDADPPSWRRHLVHGPMFLWLGQRDAEPLTMAVLLPESHDQAVALAGATPTTHSGLGQWGWLTVPLDGVDAELVCDWVDESYRAKAPKKLVAELDRRGTGR